MHIESRATKKDIKSESLNQQINDGRKGHPFHIHNNNNLHVTNFAQDWKKDEINNQT